MLVFRTPGLIPIDSFTTFGLNAKPGVENPIGFFGTGLKYTVAIVLRLGGTMRVFRGTEEYEFYTLKSEFRDKEFRSVRMRKKTRLGKWGRSIKLPFTLELGKNWEPWMAVRELESNTRDECGESVVINDETAWGMSYLNSFEPSEFSTSIWVDCPRMETAYTNGTIFLESEDLEQIESDQENVEIYNSPSSFIYMNGIRVSSPDRPCLFTYNITTPLELTEDRTPKYTFMMNHYILAALRQMEDADRLDELFGVDDGKFYETTLEFDEAGESSDTFMSRLGTYMGGGGTFARAQTYYKSMTTVDMDASVTVRLSTQDWVDMANGRQVSERQRSQIVRTLINYNDLDPVEIGLVQESEQ